MSCTKTCFYKGKKVKNSLNTCKKHDGVGVAAWLCQSVAATFFASLEFCCCVYIETRDGPEDDSIVQLNLIPYAEKEDYNSSQILKHN
jgi:hypothetical protein